MSDEQLSRVLRDLEKVRELRDSETHGSEMWRFYDHDVKNLTRVVVEHNEDERGALRSWGPGW